MLEFRVGILKEMLIPQQQRAFIRRWAEAQRWGN
jgi:hypothetical protein